MHCLLYLEAHHTSWTVAGRRLSGFFVYIFRQRWTRGDEANVDERATTIRPEPSAKLSEDEQQAVLAACNRVEHAHLPSSQIVPRLDDEGIYLASESAFYRLLKENSSGICVDGRTHLARERHRTATVPRRPFRCCRGTSPI